MKPSFNPWMIGAAAATPFLLKNDDRGYFQTAAVTTPLVAAGFTMARPFGSSVRTAAQNVNASMERFKAASQTTSSFQNRFASVTMQTPFVDISEIRSRFDALRGDPQYNVLLSHAIESARSQVMTMPELMANPLRDLSKSLYSPEDMLQIARQFEDRPKFWSVLGRSLRRAEHLKVGAGLAFPAQAAASEVEHIGLSLANAESFSALENFNPDYAAKIKNLLGSQKIESAVMYKQAGDVLGVKLRQRTGLLGSKGRASELYIPFEDLRTGMYWMGPDFRLQGYGRRVWVPNGNTVDVFEPDHFLFNNLDRYSLDELNAASQKIFNYTGRSPDNAWKAANQLDTATQILPKHARMLRNQEAVPAPLKLFRNERGELDYYTNMPVEAKSVAFQKLYEKGYVTIGSEGGVPEGIVQSANVERFQVLGSHEMKKQSPLWRGMTKGVYVDPHSVQETELGAYTSSSGFRKLTDWGPDLPVPEVGLTVGAITPQQRKLLGRLPSQLDKLHDLDVQNQAVEAIMDDFGVDRNTAAGIYQKWTANMTESRLAAVRKVQALGEGDILISGRYRSLHLNATATLQVDQLHNITDGEVHSIEDLINVEFDSDRVIGFRNNAPVTSPGKVNRILSVTPLEESQGGGYSVTVAQDMSMAGSKWDVAGVKGLSVMLNSEAEAQEISGALNDLYQAAGKGTPFHRGVSAFALQNYLHHKVDSSMAARSMLETALQVADAVERPVASNALDAHILQTLPLKESRAAKRTEQFYQTLEQQGFKIHMVNGKVHAMELTEQIQSSKQLERIQSVTEMTQTYLEDMGRLAMDRDSGTLDRLFHSYRTTGGPFDRFLEKFSFGTVGTVWDSSRLNVSTDVRATFDLWQEMYRQGNTEAMSEIMGRLQFEHGDPRKAAAFAQHLADNGGDFTSQQLGNVFTLDQLLVPEHLGQDARIGGLFSPSDARFADNFTIDLGQTFSTVVGNRKYSVRYLPVLGHEAFGGGLNRYGVGQYQSTGLENQLHQLLQVAKSKAQQRDAEMAVSLKNYFEEMGDTLYGKSGFLRAGGSDPLAVSGYIQTRATQNPFDLVISPNMLNRIQDQSVADRIRRGEAFAVATRQPISAAPFVRVRMGTEADFLDQNIVGMGEQVRSLFQADDDLDRVNLMFLKSDTAIAEARAAIDNQTSAQWEALRYRKLVQGYGEDAERIRTSSLMEMAREDLGMAKRVEKLVQARSTEGALKNVSNRLSSVVGKYSNLLTTFQFGLETSGLNLSDRTLMETLLWNVRQVPIAMQKGKSSYGKTPLLVHSLLENSLRTDLTMEHRVNSLYEGLTKASEQMFTSIVDERNLAEYAGLGLEEYYRSKLQPGKQLTVNVMQDFLTQQKQRVLPLFETYLTGFRSEAHDMTRLLTRVQPDLVQSEFWLKNVDKVAPYLMGFYGGQSRPGATHAAEMLSQANSELKAAARSLAGPAKNAKKYLLAGLGAAAVLGAVMGPGSSPRAGVRPEEATGVPDRVPGAGQTGAHSSNPPRQPVTKAGGVRRTMVAPIRSDQNVEVEVEAPSRQDAIEYEKRVNKLKPAKSVVYTTVNHHGGWRDAASKRRLREQIREDLERVR